MIVYLHYWTPAGRIQRKKFKTVEEARTFGRKLRQKEGYVVIKYGSIHVYGSQGGITQYDL